MNEKMEVINKLLIELFNNVQEIEEKALKCEEISDLSITEIHTIEVIGINTEKTMSQIAKSLKITSGTLTACINKLIKKGYVERKRIEEDRRVVLINLTEKGENAYKYHEKFRDDMINNTTKKLDEEEQEVLISSLSKIKKFFMENIIYKSIIS